MLLLCAGTAAMSSLMAAALQEWQFLVFASVVTAGWLAAAFVWRRSHPWR
jgi:hypothetical protein